MNHSDEIDHAEHAAVTAERDAERAAELASVIRLNITDGQGILLGQVEVTPDELRNARSLPMAALAFADEIAGEAGVTGQAPASGSDAIRAALARRS